MLCVQTGLRMMDTKEGLPHSEEESQQPCRPGVLPQSSHICAASHRLQVLLLPYPYFHSSQQVTDGAAVSKDMARLKTEAVHLSCSSKCSAVRISDAPGAAGHPNSISGLLLVGFPQQFQSSTEQLSLDWLEVAIGVCFLKMPQESLRGTSCCF